MFNKKCEHCGNSYNLKNVRVDEHWNTWTAEPVNCYCPHCNGVLERARPDSVDLAKKLTLNNILIGMLFFVFSLLGVATNTLEYVGPIMLLLFGAYLVIYSKSKDHRIIGWLLIILSVIVVGWFNASA